MGFELATPRSMHFPESHALPTEPSWCHSRSVFEGSGGAELSRCSFYLTFDLWKEQLDLISGFGFLFFSSKFGVFSSYPYFMMFPF